MTITANTEFHASASANLIPSHPEIEASPIFQAIAQAIEGRLMIRFKYRDDAEPRLYSPYLFRVTKGGNFVMKGMQNLNPNSREDYDLQKTFRFEKITTVEITNKSFVPIDTFTPFDKSHSTGIIACILPWK